MSETKNSEWIGIFYNWVDGKGWQLATNTLEDAILNGYSTDLNNINIVSDYTFPVIGKYRVLDSHGLPARYIEPFLFNRRTKR